MHAPRAASNAFSMLFTQWGTNVELTLETGDEFAIAEDERFAFRHRPVDLAHLARYTLGDSVLEHEVLELFRRQTRIYFDKLSHAASDDSWCAAARVLKASARSVGAWQILLTAENLERSTFNCPQAVRLELLKSLDEQIREAHAFIDDLA